MDPPILETLFPDCVSLRDFPLSSAFESQPVDLHDVSVVHRPGTGFCLCGPGGDAQE